MKKVSFFNSSHSDRPLSSILILFTILFKILCILEFIFTVKPERFYVYLGIIQQFICELCYSKFTNQLALLINIKI